MELDLGWYYTRGVESFLVGKDELGVVLPKMARQIVCHPLIAMMHQ
jgi:hypothetical protein